MLETVCLLLAVVDEQNQQTEMFNEDAQTVTARNAAVISSEATLHDIEENVEHCSLRLFKPFHDSRNLDTADVDQRNVRVNTNQPTNCTQTSSSATNRVLLPSHGYFCSLLIYSPLGRNHTSLTYPIYQRCHCTAWRNIFEKSSHRQQCCKCKVRCTRAHLLCGAFRRRGLNPYRFAKLQTQTWQIYYKTECNHTH